MKSNEETFDYEPDGYMVFPIDYSEHEIEGDLKMNRQGFSRNVLQHSFFKGILDQLYRSDQKNDDLIRSDNIKNTCVPLETKTFLTCFYRLVKDEKYSDYKAIIRKNGKIKEGVMEKFIDDLCQMLSEETLPESNDENNEFCRHILFQNERFSTAVLNNVWKKEIITRYQKLHKLAQQAPFDAQANALMNCLRSLDRAILDLKSSINSNKSDSSPGKSEEAIQNPEFALQEMLKQLLSERIKDGSNKKCNSVYKVRNIKVDDKICLSEAFQQLKHPRNDKQLLQKARQSYLSYLAKKVESQKAKHIQQSLKFEKKYLELQRYFDNTPFKIGQEGLESLISDRCKKYCLNVIEFCMHDINSEDVPTLAFTEPSYNAYMIDSIIQYHMNVAISQFRETLHLVSYYNAFNHAEQINYRYQFGFFTYHEISTDLLYHPVPMTSFEPNFYYESASKFRRYFQTAWKWLFGNNSPIFHEDTHKFINLDSVASILYEKGKVAAELFDKNNLFFSSLDQVCLACCLYEATISYPEMIVPAYCFSNSIPKLLSAIFLLILQRIFEGTVPRVMEDIKLYLSSL